MGKKLKLQFLNQLSLPTKSIIILVRKLINLNSLSQRKRKNNRTNRMHIKLRKKLTIGQTAP